MLSIIKRQVKRIINRFKYWKYKRKIHNLGGRINGKVRLHIGGGILFWERAYIKRTRNRHYFSFSN